MAPILPQGTEGARREAEQRLSIYLQLGRGSSVTMGGGEGREAEPGLPIYLQPGRGSCITKREERGGWVTDD